MTRWLLLALSLLAARGEIAVNDFFPFGPAQGDLTVPRVDDGGTGAITLGIPFPFFGSFETEIFVGTNGVISFRDLIRGFVPQSFPLNGNLCVAPFWGDVDVRNGGTIYYRQETRSSQLLLLDLIVQPVSPGFTSAFAFVATWDDVAAFGRGGTLRNTFQAIIVTNGQDSFAIFNYNNIEWTTGTASSVDAQVGFNAGDGIRSFAIEQSQSPAVANVVNLSNLNPGVPGRFLFRINGEDITADECTTISASPFFADILGGQQITITTVGDCFGVDEDILCRWQGTGVDIAVPASFMSTSQVMCETPVFSGESSITLQVSNDGGASFPFSTPFFVSNFIDTNVPQATVQCSDLLEPDSPDTCTVSWDPSEFSEPVDIIAACVDGDGVWVEETLLSGVPNDGTNDFSETLFEPLQSDNSFSACYVTVGAGDLVFPPPPPPSASPSASLTPGLPQPSPSASSSPSPTAFESGDFGEFKSANVVTADKCVDEFGDWNCVCFDMSRLHMDCPTSKSVSDAAESVQFVLRKVPVAHSKEAWVPPQPQQVKKSTRALAKAVNLNIGGFVMGAARRLRASFVGLKQRITTSVDDFAINVLLPTLNYDFNLPLCPCNAQAGVLPAGYSLDPACDGVQSFFDFGPDCQYHPGAAFCLRQTVPLADGSGQQCCYDASGAIILASGTGGTADRFSSNGGPTGLVKHFIFDVLPAKFYAAIGRTDLYEVVRPIDPDCQPTPRPAWGGGDPHFITLDGLRYTFNGHGDFILMRVPSSIMVQGRMLPSTTSQATVNVGFAFQSSLSDVITVGLSGQNGVFVQVGGVTQLFSSSIGTRHFPGAAVTLESSRVVVTLEGLVEFEIVASRGALRFKAQVDTSLAGLTEGLLGNFNGDPSDDLTNRGGSILISTVSSADLHTNFGLTWMVQDETESLFTYNAVQTFAVINVPSFSPTFIDAGSVDPAALATCGGSATCAYDLVVSGDSDFALETAAAESDFDAFVAEVNNANNQITCTAPSVNFGTLLNIQGVVVNDTLVATCLDGFRSDVLPLTATCLSSGEFSPTIPSCEPCDPNCTGECRESVGFDCDATATPTPTPTATSAGDEQLFCIALRPDITDSFCDLICNHFSAFCPASFCECAASRPSGPSRPRYVSVRAPATDAWCDQNCNAPLPFCPSHFCALA